MRKKIRAYIEGTLRKQLYYSKWFYTLLPLYIFEQISYRIFVMDKTCLLEGSCTMCGCSTPALQMANKACDKPCYPAMVDEVNWEVYKRVNSIQFFYRGERRDFELRISHKTVML